MNSSNPLIQALPEGPLDVVGDVHGEYNALLALLGRLGYGASGVHPDKRTLIFVGDLCDRGPDSVRVIRLVRGLVEAGKALAIVGNHELNLLRDEAKDGSGWFFDERVAADQRYQPFARPSPEDRLEIRRFLETLPVVLERQDLRVVHAAWQPKDIEIVRHSAGATAHQLYDRYQSQVDGALMADGRYQRYLDAKLQWRAELEDPDFQIPFLQAIAEHDVASQAGNPVRVLTSGVEREGSAPFFSSHKWRFVERIPWWDEYQDAIPVIIGHYWRMAIETDRTAVGKGDHYLFEGLAPNAWHGARKNVFCVDFSVGGRWHERHDGSPLGQRFRLAAMRWPEQELVFDTGQRLQTSCG